jgi:hypothetical protein
MLQLTPEEQVLQALDCASAYGIKKSDWMRAFLSWLSFQRQERYEEPLEMSVDIAIREANDYWEIL